MSNTKRTISSLPESCYNRNGQSDYQHYIKGKGRAVKKTRTAKLKSFISRLLA